jgi:hypothetical protein
MGAMQPDSIKLQDRDVEVLRDLFVSRVMTGEHIAKLHFNGSEHAAKQRLRKLKIAGLIKERPRHVTEPAILFLTRPGFDTLREKGKLTDYPQLSSRAMEKRANVSKQTIHHELEVMDVKAAFHSAIRGTDRFTVAEFSTWPLLYQFEAFRSRSNAKPNPVRPDGFICIHENKADGSVWELPPFFLEVDRSHEGQNKLADKAACYLDYYKSGGFAERNGKPRSDYKEFPFRVLMVLKNAERRNNTAERLLQSTPPIFTLVSLSTFAEVTANPLAPIWITPADYREATKGTPYDPDHRRPTSVYRRQIEREALVESRIEKQSILL